jgi:integrase/recombinase XerD
MSVWDRSLRRVFKLAKIEGRHNAHRFRDTFATSLLSKGVPLETVSVLLGHQSTRYSPWVRARQDALVAAVQATWKPESA